MENASKALFIAVGVFLGIMLLTVMIYIFRQGAKVNESYDQKQISLQLELYNSRFEEFDRSDNNIIDVISLCNLAFDTNKDCEFDQSLAVQIDISVGSKIYKIPNKNTLTKRNTILDGTKEKSIYDLVESTLKDLSVLTIPQKTGIFSLTELPENEKVTIDYDVNMDKLSTTKLKDGKTIYKFLFATTPYKPIEYNKHNGKISKITLIAYCNPEWKD